MNEADETRIQEMDAEVVPTQAITKRDLDQTAEAMVKLTDPITAQQAKVNAVADLTMSAYSKAATLRLTKEESDALQADFPDDAFKSGAAGKENLIYIEHAFLRDRFLRVFGMGQWAIISRRSWSEHFTIPAYGNKPPVEGERVYVEAMLIVRGCFVGEAIGAMEYYPKNNAQNYGDAVEGAKTAAFRRCAKEFGVGLQAWKKDWCDGWWARKRATSHPGSVGATPRSKTATTPPKPAEPPAKEATEATREWMVKEIDSIQAREKATQFCIDLGWLMPNEALEELPLRFVATSKLHFSSFMLKMAAWSTSGKAEKPYAGGALEEPKVSVKKDDGSVDYEPPSEDVDEPWRSFPVPFGKSAGVVLGELEKPKLFGFWANFLVETEYNGKAKKPETIAKDRAFREALDAAGAHYEFTKKD
jgi:hypothetical protein